MQFSDIRARAAFLAHQDGWDKALPAPDWSALVNRAVADFSWDAEYNLETVNLSSVQNQASYTIPVPYFRNLKDCVYATQSTTPTALTKSSEADERKTDPLWQQRPMGTPTRWVVMAPNVIRILEIPSVSGDTISVFGSRVAPPLSADTDIPGFPDTWHEALALRAAVLYCEPWLRDPVPGATPDMPRAAASATVEMWREQYAGMVRECRSYMAGERFSRIQRTVQRATRPRTYVRQSGRYY